MLSPQPANTSCYRYACLTSVYIIQIAMATHRLEHFPSLRAHTDHTNKQLFPPPDPRKVHGRPIVLFIRACLFQVSNLQGDWLESDGQT